MPQSRNGLTPTRPAYARATAGELLMVLAEGRTTIEAADHLRVPVGDVKVLPTRAAVRYGVRARPALATRSETAAIAHAAGLAPRDLPARISRLRVRAGARTTTQLVALGHPLKVLTARPIPEPVR
ncbi:hypothetical protein [Streptomyces sp. NPDC059816]|uniref:hypothetical protein n=1 Tax=Streptomyces sp. NPDC059816 TaxID=3346960 RepID=UPI00365206AF